MRRTNFIYTDPDPSTRLALAVPAIARAEQYCMQACAWAAITRRSRTEEPQENEALTTEWGTACDHQGTPDRDVWETEDAARNIAKEYGETLIKRSVSPWVEVS